MPFVFLVTALLFARSGLYGRREARPGFPAIVAGLFVATFVSLVFALVNGLDFSSYYIFYGGLFFALIWVTGLRWLYERGDRRSRCARWAARRRAILVGSGQADRRGRARAAGRRLRAPATSRSATSR